MNRHADTRENVIQKRRHGRNENEDRFEVFLSTTITFAEEKRNKQTRRNQNVIELIESHTIAGCERAVWRKCVRLCSFYRFYLL